MFVQYVAECLHLCDVGSLQIDIRDGMETYKVDFAVESRQQFQQCVCMTGIIVQILEDNIFEREVTLVTEVILT